MKIFIKKSFFYKNSHSLNVDMGVLFFYVQLFRLIFIINVFSQSTVGGFFI